MVSNQDYTEKIRQLMKDHNSWMESSINLIASENITSSRVKEALLSDLSHRYAEGLPGERLYEGCRYIDEIEELTIELSKRLFRAEHANVQPTSGVVANLACFFATAEVGDPIMAMEVPYGGHISHARVSAAGVRGFQIYTHPFDFENMNIDADAMKKKILEVKPRIILFGGSLFLFPHPVEEALEAAEEVGARIMYDGAHVLGLIAGGYFQDPLREGADMLVGSTHKTFPGPQGGIILCREELAADIDEAVFPGLVSNHHLHHVAGLGIATAEMLEFGAEYAAQTINNARKLAENLHELGFNVLCEHLDFTESHQVVMDVSDIGRAAEISKRLEANNIILNKNLLPWDDVNRSDDPSGIRIGTQEITRRGMKESEMSEVAEYIKRVVMDGKDVRDEVAEFMSSYTRVHYAFEDSEAYKYMEIQ
ncbi:MULTISPECIES: serine hydroxymethyltransferase [Methanothermobacter]|uniref:Serine hydroxymethyltransferase n=2 Tax=Methanothermobacter TaxID=145260 RepID=GLYA_METTH|nr:MULTISPECIES: serine hydroxymethyltransferase [Methanothermobacter]O27433.2 RecName: Full=Serine hydroxymethyltransferase; Short=SHMT; Short=Serine methylase [Methanothermobacter thermautotrophicus str. Delta H]MDN5374260.1 glycine hydroxymethyltransferase [Methanothermobacter sp.]REE28022.1 serine hydroxymethyltransferase [Methanothermobacter defluvii]WBF05903.1 serine hydroxymethyltransferase [Methanothermobacter thermautotrophicus]BAZ99383.1 Serine hydroxymethyltransferase [Methanothermo